MPLHPLAGQPAPADALIDVARLEREFVDRTPDPGDPRQRVKFGTSGHRGTSLDGTLPQRTSSRSRRRSATTAALIDHGPLYLGKDTHALSSVAAEVCARSAGRQRRDTIIQQDDDFTPTPVISHAILMHNRGRGEAPGRRHRDHCLAQPPGGRWIQVQPAERRPGRHGHHHGWRSERTNCSPRTNTKSPVFA